MALSRLIEFEASSRRHFIEHDLMHFEVYTAEAEKAGQAVDILVDEAGHFQYLVVELSNGMAGKHVLLPHGEFQVDRTTRRIYAIRLNLTQVADLAAYNSANNNKTANAFDEEVTESSCSF